MSDGFWSTPVGTRFLEETVPALVKQMERIADALEGLLTKWAKRELRRR